MGMSYDYEIATNGLPEHRHLVEFLSSKSGFSATSELRQGQGDLIINRVTRTRSEPAFEVYGPFHAEPDDLAEILAESVLAPRWLVQVSVPGGWTKIELDTARALAIHIAKSCEGAVLDPQTNEILWPRGKRKRFKAPAKEHRIRVVTLRWYLPESQKSVKTAKVFLNTLRRMCPEAVPTRFGTYEPLQNRLEPGEDAPFLKMWKEQSQKRVVGDFFFKSKSPCFGGSVDIPGVVVPMKRKIPKECRRAVTLDLDFDGRALHGDPKWLEAVVTLFVELSVKLRAFYSAAYVQREYIASRGSLFFDALSEWVSPVCWSYGLGFWYGLPAAPTWLAYFGKPYMSEVEDSIREWKPKKTPNGLFLRLGTEPMDLQQLHGKFPELPPKTLAQNDEEEEGVPAEFIPDLE